ncbi:MAG: ankyrin repeat domain-containing protein [Treponema sp.]|nr:ankyrin repeat domain-containing protein [Treponema sp.]
MNTNYLLFLYTNQKSFDSASKIQSGLREKIKNSDFLITDDSGTHRIIGIKYNHKLNNVPFITCICMRHEMSAAKQIAFEYGKKLFYDSKISALFFRYQAGEFVQDENSRIFLTLFYVQFYSSMWSNGIFISSEGKIYIKNQCLPPYFKLSYLINLLGEPDDKGTGMYKQKLYSWYKYGIMAVSFSGHKGYVGHICIYVKAIENYLLYAKVNIYLGLDKIENAGSFYRFRKYGNHYVVISTWNKNGSFDCMEGEIEMISISFGFFPCKFSFAIIENDKEKVLSLIKKGFDINRRTGWLFETPLMFAIRNNRFDFVELLLENGANPDIPDVFGKTPKQILMEKNQLNS